MKSNFYVAILTAFCVSQAFSAQLVSGTRQLSVGGSIDQTDKLNLRLNGNAGYFIMDQMEVGILGEWSMLHGNDITTISAGAFSEYNILLADTDEIVPYLGASLSLKYASYDIAGNKDPHLPNTIDQSNSALELCGYAGARYFMVENLAIGSALRLFFATDDIYYSDNGKFDAFNWDIILNTSFYF